MKKILISTYALAAVAVTPLAHAQLAGNDESAGAFGEFISTLVGFFQEVVIPFLFAIGFLAVVWGMIQYFVLGGANDEAKAKGKSLIIYSIAGFVLILAFWGIVNLLSGGLGFESRTVNPPDIGVSI